MRHNARVCAKSGGVERMISTFESGLCIAAGSDLLITSVCNTMDVAELSTHKSIYYPQVIRRPLPAAGSRQKMILAPN